MREYRVYFLDGSEEIVEAPSIADARQQAEQLYDNPIRRIVATADLEPVGADDDDDPDDDEEEDDEEE